MNEGDDSFLEQGINTENQLYRLSVQQMYKCLDEGTPIDAGQVMKIASYARIEQETKALAFLARECALSLVEVSDRYISTTGERAKFLGFTVVMHPRDLERQALIPIPEELGRQARFLSAVSKLHHPEAGTGTVQEVAPGLLEIDESFIPKENIWLNEEEKKTLGSLEDMRADVKKRVIASVRKIEKFTKSKLRHIFQKGKVATQKMLLSDLHAVSRGIIDIQCLVEANIYATAMGQATDLQKGHELACRFVALQMSLSGIEEQVTQ